MQSYERRAPAARAFRGRLEEYNYGHSAEDAPDRLALHADSLPVDDSQVDETLFPGGLDVGLHHRFDVSRRHCMEVKYVVDGEFENFFFGFHGVTTIANRQGFLRVYTGSGQNNPRQLPPPYAGEKRAQCAEIRLRQEG